MWKLVARREFSERSHERSFLISSGITLAIIVLAVSIPALLGLGGPSKFTIAGGDAQGRAIAARAAQRGDGFDAEVTVEPRADVTVTGTTIHAHKEPDDKLANLLQAANRQLDVRPTPPLPLQTAQPIAPEKDSKAGLAFFAIF